VENVLYVFHGVVDAVWASTPPAASIGPGLRRP
jgi:hypothetical protein